MNPPLSSGWLSVGEAPGVEITQKMETNVVGAESGYRISLEALRRGAGDAMTLMHVRIRTWLQFPSAGYWFNLPLAGPTQVGRYLA